MQREIIQRLVRLWVVGMLAAAWLLASRLLAQEGQTWGPYNVNTSWEFGGRFLSRDGSLDKYRSDLNYGRGARLFNFNFLAHAGDPSKTTFFDNLQMDGFGFGGDPNSMLRLHSEKTRWYEFDYAYRKDAYFSSLSNIALGQHSWDLDRRWQDFGLTLFPQSRVHVLLGYSRNSLYGPSLTTYDFSRDEFALNQNVRRQNNDYRVGLEARLGGALLSFEQGFRTYREDDQQRDTVPNPGNSLGTPTLLNSLLRNNPTRIFAPYTRLGLHADFWKRFDFSGRYLYSGSSTDYVQAQVLTGRDSSNNIVNLQSTSVLARARRPNAAFDTSLTFKANDRIWLSDSVSLTNYRIDGESTIDETLLRSRVTPFGQTTLPPLVTEDIGGHFIGVRYVQNQFDVNIRPAKQFVFRAAHRYINRRTLVGDLGEEREDRSTRANTVLLGFRFQPHHNFGLFYDYEHGIAINPFTPISNFRVNNHRMRAQFRPHKTLLFSGTVVSRDNRNPTPLIQNEFRNHSYALNATWVPNERLTLDMGYDRLHVDTDSNILFFIAFQPTNGRSIYISNNNLFYSSARITLHKRLELYAGYRILKDSGTNRLPSSPGELIGQFPLKFATPEVRLAVKLRNGVEWIMGYQYYRYLERLATVQNYRAHLPYTSLRLYF